MEKTTLTSILSHPKKSLILLSVCWTVMQLVVLGRFGIVTDQEAEKYIYNAQYFLDNGRLTASSFWLYFTQIVVLSLALKLKVGLVSVYLLQLLFNCIACYIMFSFSRNVFGTITAFLMTLLFILCYPIQGFTPFLQTESLFISFTIIYSCYLLNIKTLSRKHLTLIALWLILLLFSRPTGLFYIPCTLFYLYFRFFDNYTIKFKLITIAIVTFIFVFLLNNAIGIGGSLDFMAPQLNENIICGVPTIAEPSNIKMAENPNSIYGLFYYISHNSEQFARLAYLRTTAFFGLYRSYFSTGHNLFLIGFFFPMYLLVILSIKYWWKNNKNLLLFASSIILFNWLTAILSCADWHNRFFLSIAFFIFLLGLPAMGFLVKKMFPKE